MKRNYITRFFLIRYPIAKSIKIGTFENGLKSTFAYDKIYSENSNYINRETSGLVPNATISFEYQGDNIYDEQSGSLNANFCHFVIGSFSPEFLHQYTKFERADFRFIHYGAGVGTYIKGNYTGDNVYEFGTTDLQIAKHEDDFLNTMYDFIPLEKDFYPNLKRAVEKFKRKGIRDRISMKLVIKVYLKNEKGTGFWYYLEDIDFDVTVRHDINKIIP